MAGTRRPNQLRPTRMAAHPTAAASGVLITQGRTRVLCTASVSAEVPRWLAGDGGVPPAQGWVTAEYAMLPGATPQRKRRGTDSRATEIQRLIGRSLRAAVDLTKMPGITVTCDCDVLLADGGTRTAAISGAFVALAEALRRARADGLIERSPLRGPVAAVSVGLVDGVCRLDLDYDLDRRAAVDMNVAMNHRGQFIEIQGTAEAEPYDRDQLDAMLALAARGIRKLMRLQRETLGRLAGRH